MKSPEPVNPQRQDWGNWVQGGETAHGYQVSSGDDENVLELDSVTSAQLHDHTNTPDLLLL